MFTEKEELILKKIVEVQIAQAAWNSMSQSYGDQVRAATKAKSDQLKPERDIMDLQYAEVQKKNSELKALVEA